MGFQNNDRFLQHLFSIIVSAEFPYQSVLQEQIANASVSIIEDGFNFCVVFDVSHNVRYFPRYLQSVPLSWHTNVDGVPVTIDLHILHGYIKTLKVIDMSFGHLNWDKLFENPCVYEMVYDDEHINGMLLDKKTKIEKVWAEKTTIFCELRYENRSGIVSFLGCEIFENNSESVTNICGVFIEKINSRASRYTISSNGKTFAFSCQLICFESSEPW